MQVIHGIIIMTRLMIINHCYRHILKKSIEFLIQTSAMSSNANNSVLRPTMDDAKGTNGCYSNQTSLVWFWFILFVCICLFFSFCCQKIAKKRKKVLFFFIICWTRILLLLLLYIVLGVFWATIWWGRIASIEEGIEN